MTFLFLFFPPFEVHKISVNGFYTSKQTTILKKDLSSVGVKVCLLVCVYLCVCVFWVQRSKRHDCVRTLACTTSSSEAQTRHS